MPPVRIAALILTLTSLVFSAFWVARMIREINLAEGKPGTVSFLLLFGGGIYLLGRHSRAVPTGTVTRVVFLLLIPINFLTVGLFLLLGRS
jgi:hypothetical protein